MTNAVDHETSFEKLLESIWDAALQCGPKSRLITAEKPVPFVAPTLRVSEASSGATPFSAEVVFLQAPAAVGKTTMARFLSASRRAPLLNLAKVPVATGTLKALISDLPGDDPIGAFHAGKLPVIVDALDEGRMLSGEQGFEAFLETTGEFLLSERREIKTPKIVILGRPESVDLARVGLELSGDGITMSAVEVGFFGESAAYEMIDAYARSVAKPASSYLKSPDPVRALIGAYFDAIEAALGLAKGDLWRTPEGRAFAGYAPVLSALGLLLAEVENFKEIENKLRAEGTQEAWGVIEEVLDTILKREKNKLCDQLATQVAGPVPAEAYDADEQLAFVTRHVHGQQPEGSGRVRLASPKDQRTYESMVAQYLPDHPFVRGGKLENPVLGSVVLAHAVNYDLLTGVDLGLLATMSKQPFLWRSLRKQLNEDPMVDGRYLGYVLASYWNEPLTKDHRVFVRSADEGSADVHVATAGQEVRLMKVTEPITFFGLMRDCDVEVSGKVVLVGKTRGSSSVFEVLGQTTVMCDEMQVDAELLVIHGKIWFEAQGVTTSPRLEISLKNGTKVGWGGQLAEAHPWNRYQSTLEAPYATPAGDKLARLLSECARRLADAGALNFYSDYSVVIDKRMRWAAREFEKELPALVKLMVEHGLATKDRAPINQMRVHFNVTWRELLAALTATTVPPRLKDFLADARKAIV